MNRCGLSVSAVVVIACIPSIFADSYAPYCENVQIDATGRFYVVVKVLPGGPEDPGRGTPVEISLAKRKDGSAPVAAARAPYAGEANRDEDKPQIKVREGDTLHGTSRHQRAPSRIVISTTGLGFVGLGVTGYNYAWPGQRQRSNDAVVFVSADGNVKLRKDTLDLFNDGEMSLFLSTAGGVWWCGGGWFDERNKQFVIVGNSMESRPKQRFFRVLDLETGKLSHGSADLIVKALKDGNVGAMMFALELVDELELKNAQPYLSRILWGGAFAPEIRSRAAVALAAMGDFQGASVVADCALQLGDYYSVSQLPMVLNDNAAPVIRDVIKRHSKKVEHSAWLALKSLGAKAVPTLQEMLDDADHAEVQYVAAEAACSIGAPAKATVPFLIAILEGHTTENEDRWRVQGTAAAALESIGIDAKSAIPALIKFRDAAKAHLDEVKANQPENTFMAEYAHDNAVDALKKLDE